PAARQAKTKPGLLTTDSPILGGAHGPGFSAISAPLQVRLTGCTCSTGPPFPGMPRARMPSSGEGLSGHVPVRETAFMTGACGKDDDRRRSRARQNATRRVVAGRIAVAGVAAMLAVPAAASAASAGSAGAGARGSLAQPSGPTLES